MFGKMKFEFKLSQIKARHMTKAFFLKVFFKVKRKRNAIFHLSLFNLLVCCKYSETKMADTQEERLKRDEQIRETIMAKLVESGEKDKLKEMLRERLVQCGWRDELKEHCKDIIRRKGLEKVTVEELVAEITPHGRGELKLFSSATLLS